MWFTASLFFQSVHNGRPEPGDVWEQQIVLVWASSEEEAGRLAVELGMSKQHDYVSATGDHVNWVFAGWSPSLSYLSSN